MTPCEVPQVYRTALYVDFDNLRAGLEGGCLSKAFCRNPQSWLARLERGWGAPDGGRRILVARAYLNPSAHAEHRRPLTSAGFEVVDTPSLTTQGKSGADIRMALDVNDALTGPVHYDEFILLSGDSDFTPVLYRLRAAGRRTMIVSSQPVASAYRRVADVVVDRGSLAEFLGAPAAPAPAADAPRPAPAPAAVVSIDPLPLVLDALASVVASGWVSEGSLAEAIVAEAAAAGRTVDAATVKSVLAVYSRAGLDVRLAAEPTAAAFQRTYDALGERAESRAWYSRSGPGFGRMTAT